MLKKIIFVVLAVFMSSNLFAEEDRKEPPTMYDPVCAKELDDVSETYYFCLNSVTIKSRQDYSPGCLSELESKNKLATVSCLQEQARMIISSSTLLQKCAQTLPISLKCRERVVSDLGFVQSKLNHCVDAIQKTSHICGTDSEANKKCYEEHMSELIAVCR